MEKTNTNDIDDGTMRIKLISVRGLFHNFDHNIELSDEGLTFIHAQNGVGKSTTLKMIYDLFSGNFDELRKYIFDSMQVVTDCSTIDVIKNDDFSVLMDGKKISADEIKGLLYVLYLPPERIYIDNGEDIIFAPREYGKEMQNIFGESETSLDNFDSPTDSFMNLADDEIIFRCMDLKARVDFITEAGLKLKMPSDMSFPPSRYELSTERDKYVEFLSSLQAWTDRYYEVAESISAFFDIVNGFLYNKKLVFDDKHWLSVQLNDGTQIMPKYLSAGEKQIMVMTYSLLFHSKNGSLTIVDEPEISLHVSWQQRLGSLFLDISRIRNIQIIVATHSPQIIHDLWDLAVELGPERA